MCIYYFARFLTHISLSSFPMAPHPEPIPQARKSPGGRNLPHTEAPCLDGTLAHAWKYLFGSQPSGSRAFPALRRPDQRHLLVAPPGSLPGSVNGALVLLRHGGAPSPRTSPRQSRCRLRLPLCLPSFQGGGESSGPALLRRRHFGTLAGGLHGNQEGADIARGHR